MCIFSGKVARVEGTNIFARRTGKYKQALIYQMEVSLSEPMAMILPLPVKTPASEESIVFHDLSAYKDLFAKLEQTVTRKKSAGKKAAAPASAPLVVHDVGSFVASFVPSVQDFDRLDERFRLPKELWRSLPQYKDYGFAVFQLKPDKEVHPMAFEFKTRDASRLFFPTVHIHDGESIAKSAVFDHSLYFQGARADYQTKRERWGTRFLMKQVPMLQGKAKSSAAPRKWMDEHRQFSEIACDNYINEKKALGLIKESLPTHRVFVEGRKPNVDHWVTFEAPKKKSAPKKPTRRVAAKKVAPKKPVSVAVKKTTKKKVAAKPPSTKKPAAKKLVKKSAARRR